MLLGVGCSKGKVAYFTFETPIFMSVPPKFFTKNVVHNPNSSLFFVQK
jgi:hypothetical protein